MIINKVKKFCEEHGISYVYSIKVGEKFYFCALNKNTSMYTFYQKVGDSIEIYEDNLSLVSVKFKRNILMEMGGIILEREEN